MEDQTHIITQQQDFLLRSSIRKRPTFGRGRFANRPYNGLILHAFPFPLPKSYSISLGFVAEQTIDNTGIGEGRGIAEIVEFIGCDLAQDPTHDLS